MAGKNSVAQCKSCPWRVEARLEDIPRYSRDAHCALEDTIRPTDVGTVTEPGLRVMACHKSTEEAPTICAGWLHNQLGPGNNLGVRLRVSLGTLPIPEVFGQQFETFRETLREDEEEDEEEDL